MANYLYNGVELPDINTVWTDKETYLYAAIVYVYSTDLYVLFLTQNRPYFYTECALNVNITYDNCVFFENVHKYAFRNGAWTFSGESNAYIFEGNSEVIWSSADILNIDDNSVYLAASDPIPVSTFTPDPISLTMGWIVGRRIAGQRGKKIEPDVFTIEWDGEVTEPNYNEYYCRVSERMFSKEELLGGTLVFGGEEYTITEELINNQNLHSDADTGSYSVGEIGQIMLVTGKAGDYYVGVANVKSFALPASGTYFVRRFDTDGKYTERLTLPNAVATPTEYLINISWGGNTEGMTVATLGTLVWAKVSSDVYALDELKYSYATWGDDGEETYLDAGAVLTQVADHAVAVGPDAYIISAVAGTYSYSGASLTIPEDGTYFLKGETQYISSLVKERT